MKHLKSCSHTTIITLSMLLLVCTLFSTPVSAASCGGVNTALIQCDEGGSGGITHLLSLILEILTIGIGIAGVIGISIAGIQYLTAGSSEEKTMKAKRRIYEIVIGIAAYVVIYGAVIWLLPTGDTATQEVTTSNDPNAKGKSKISISYSGKTTTEKSFKPTVTLDKNATNKTYSLASSNSEIARTLGTGVHCVAEGKTTITAIAADGAKASMNINCKETRYADDNSPSTNTTRNPAGSKSKTAPDGSVAASDGSATVGSQVNVKLHHEPQMRKETRKVIEEHNKDFYWNTYESYIKKNFGGSYVKYVQSLKTKKGEDSVFTAYASKLRTKGNHVGMPKLIKVKTAADFQAAAEYVWGLYNIWGPDYAAGPNAHRFWTWGGGYSTSVGTSDAFYQGFTPRWNDYYSQGNINSVLPHNVNIRTGCNLLANTFYQSTNLTRIGGTGCFVGLENSPGCREKMSLQASLSRKNGVKSSDGKIRYWDELKVGDVLYFSGHVAIVGEVYKDYVITYEGGSRYITTRDYKKKIPRKHTSSLTNTTYAGYGNNWFGYRVWDIDQSVTLKGINPE